MKAFVLVLALLAPLTVFAQTVDRNAAYIEIGGNVVVPSINYERRWNDLWAWRVGFTYVSSKTEGSNENDTAFGVPLMINRISAPQSNHHFETGLGVVLITGEDEGFNDEFDEDFSGAFGTLTVGYRYQKPAGGFVFRAGFTPVFDTEDILPWAGVSFGYAW